VSDSLDRVIVALDNMGPEDINSFMEAGGHHFKTVKLGLEAFCRRGPEGIKEFHRRWQKDIFLDLKLHDIPNTVVKAISSLKGLPVTFLTLHLSGGRRMLESAVEEAQKALPDTKLLGVSYLTSLGPEDMKEIWGYSTDQINSAFERLFQLALESKMHGLILSPSELELVSTLENRHQRQLTKITPGIRFSDELASNNTQDQQRVATPEESLKNGADYIVMGRSLNLAKNLAQRIAELREL
jgi:orotidine-5'-phosphate decarboxylase